jgi:hypothetical protein
MTEVAVRETVAFAGLSDDLCGGQGRERCGPGLAHRSRIVRPVRLCLFESGQEALRRVLNPVSVSGGEQIEQPSPGRVSAEAEY